MWACTDQVRRLRATEEHRRSSRTTRTTRRTLRSRTALFGRWPAGATSSSTGRARATTSASAAAPQRSATSSRATTTTTRASSGQQGQGRPRCAPTSSVVFSENFTLDVVDRLRGRQDAVHATQAASDGGDVGRHGRGATATACPASTTGACPRLLGFQEHLPADIAKVEATARLQPVHRQRDAELHRRRVARRRARSSGSTRAGTRTACSIPIEIELPVRVYPQDARRRDHRSSGRSTRT